MHNAQRYIRSIRNPIKRQYAAAWFGFRSGILPHAPARPSTLSIMVAQAVRMQIDLLVTPIYSHLS